MNTVARTDKRPKLVVTHDADGGLTIHDPQSELVVSIIATHPLASPPRGITIEVYDYHGKDVMAQDVPQRGDDDVSAPFRIRHHPTIAFYPANDR